MRLELARRTCEADRVDRVPARPAAEHRDAVDHAAGSPRRRGPPRRSGSRRSTEVERRGRPTVDRDRVERAGRRGCGATTARRPSTATDPDTRDHAAVDGTPRAARRVPPTVDLGGHRTGSRHRPSRSTSTSTVTVPVRRPARAVAAQAAEHPARPRSRADRRVGAGPAATARPGRGSPSIRAGVRAGWCGSTGGSG